MCPFWGQKRGFVLDFLIQRFCIFLLDLIQLNQASLYLEVLVLRPVFLRIAECSPGASEHRQGTAASAVNATVVGTDRNISG